MVLVHLLSSIDIHFYYSICTKEKTVCHLTTEDDNTCCSISEDTNCCSIVEISKNASTLDMVSSDKLNLGPVLLSPVYFSTYSAEFKQNTSTYSYTHPPPKHKNIQSLFQVYLC